MSQRGRELFFPGLEIAMNAGIRQARRIVRRLLFTLISLAALGLVAVATNSHLGELSTDWCNRLAFGPHDLLFLRWGRLVTSALVTSGGWAFWQALGVIALTVGATR